MPFLPSPNDEMSWSALDSTKLLCSSCGLPRAADAEICPRCGKIFSPHHETRPILVSDKPKTAQLEDVAFATCPARIVFIINKQLLPLPEWNVLTVGRQSRDNSVAQPDVDLSSFGALDKGVSRRHIQIRVTRYLAYVSDLHSTNGSWLNGKRITDERLLHDGDTLRLGQLKITVQVCAVTNEQAS